MLYFLIVFLQSCNVRKHFMVIVYLLESHAIKASQENGLQTCRSQSRLNISVAHTTGVPRDSIYMPQ